MTHRNSQPPRSEQLSSQHPHQDLDRWRARAIHVLLIAIAIIGLPAWGAVVARAWRDGQMSALIWVYVVVYIAILFLAIFPRIDYRMRVLGLLLLGYANGCASLARLGLMGSGRLYLLLIPIFATVFAGARAGLASAFISLATYLLFAAQNASDAALWSEAGVALAAFVVATVVLLSRFSQFQSRILNRERHARNQLQDAQIQLEAYSATLEEKVLQRTAQLNAAKSQAEAASKRFEQELQFAGRIQASFMASELPQIPGWQHAAALIPARETSGDFYNIFPLPGGRYGVLIADVVDKGVGAALFMALCWALLHTYARQQPDDPAAALKAVNRRILRDTHAGQFVTVFYAVLDPASGRLTYANAGHPPPLCLCNDTLYPLSLTGMPLGVIEDASWQQRTITMRSGDLCLLYTDGVTEAQNEQGDFFDRPRLAHILRQNANASAAEIRRALLRALERFTANMAQADDITMLILASLPAGETPSQRPQSAHSRRPQPAGAPST